MAEAVGLASGLLALIGATFEASKFLYEAVASFKSQRQTIKDVLADLEALVTVLTTIRERAQQPSERAKLEPLRQPLKCCKITCGELRKTLEDCTVHSKDGQASVRDWMRMQYHEKDFDDMKNRLSSYKSTLVIAFQSIIIKDHSATQESLESLGGLITGTKEDLEDQIDKVRETITAADESLLDALKEDQARLQGSLDSIAQAQQTAENIRPQVNIDNNHADQGSRAIFGTDTVQPNFDLSVTGNRAGVGAVVSAGVHSPESLRALLQHSQTADYALILQALQNQPTNVRDGVLQSVVKNISAEPNREAPHPPGSNLLTERESRDFSIDRQTVQSVGPVPEKVCVNANERIRQVEEY